MDDVLSSTSVASPEDRLAELYQAAKDENELLEFKNYELMFKIQELEQSQKSIINKLSKETLGAKLSSLPTTDGSKFSQNSQASQPPTTKSAACVGARSAGDIEHGRAASPCHNELAKHRGPTGRLFAVGADGLSAEATSARPNAVALASTHLGAERQPAKAREDRDGDEETRKSFALACEHSKRQASQLELAERLPVGLDANHLGHESCLGGNNASPAGEQKCGSHDYLAAKQKTNKLANDGPASLLEQRQISGLHDTLGGGECRQEQQPPPPSSITITTNGAANAPDSNNRHRAEMRRSMGSQSAADCADLIEYKAATRGDSCALLSAQQVGGDQPEPMKVTSAVQKPAESPKWRAHSTSVSQEKPSDEDDDKTMDCTSKQPDRPGWSKSQPNLHEGAKSRSGNARIAVPVSARSQLGAASGLAERTSRPNHMLRVRSKSSLAGSSLPRRLASRASSQPAEWQQSQTKQASKSSKLSASSNALNQATSSANAKPTRCGSLLAARMYNRSSSSCSIGGFVTQIPTLISQSHAPLQPMAAHSTGAPKTPEAGSSLPVCRARASTCSDNRLLPSQSSSIREPPDTSKSTLSLAESSSLLADSSDNSQLADKLLSASTLEHQAPSSTSGTSTSLGAAPTTARLVGSKSVSSLAPGAANEPQTCSLPEATSLLDLAAVVTTTDAHDKRDARQTGALARVEPSRNLNGQDEQLAKEEATHQADSSLQQQQRTSQCSQCRLLQSKLILLIRDRKQLNEQLSELEEMENDSRLMSQKLAKQLSQLEQEMELSRLELQQSRDLGAKFEFQNKRLNLELKLRLDTIEKLKCQVRSLNTSISSLQTHRHEPSGCALDKDTQQLDHQQASDTDDSGAGGSLESTSTRRTSAPAGEPAKKGVAQAVARPLERADDSAYSTKSSASSSCDAHSDDGCRSSEDGDLARNCFTSGQIASDLSAPSPDKPSVCSASSSITSSGDESDHRTGQSCAASSSLSASANQQAVRQQVLRRKASTSTRTLRNQSNQRGSLRQTDCAEGQSKAMLARVVDEAESAPSLATARAETCERGVQKSTEQAGSKSFIELALEGVEELERGRADDALRALIKTSARDGQEAASSAPVAAGQVKSEDVGAAKRQLASGEKVYTGSDLVNQLRQEISSLKTRLIHAHTLNDNLVAELRSNKEQLDEGRQQCRQPVCSARNQNHGGTGPRPGKEILGSLMSTASEQLQKQRSIIHVNGSGISVANETAGLQHRVHLQHQQQPARHSVQLNPDAKRQAYLLSASCSTIDSQCQPGAAAEVHYYHPRQQEQQQQQQQQQQQHRQLQQQELQLHCRHHHRTACVALDELVDFLRFLLDKIHFHHGRTFELVSECQKLAMNALLASYSHQMNLLHHKSVVSAGEQLASAVSLSDVPVDGSCPVRPPPRRRNPLNRMVSSGGSLDNNGQATSGSLPSALQVAKQTLFSIVPIYHSNSSNSSQNKAKVRQPSPAVESERAEVGLPASGKQSKTSKGGWIILNRSDSSKANCANHQQVTSNSANSLPRSCAVVELNDARRSSSSYKSNPDSLHSVEPSSDPANQSSKSFLDAHNLLKVKSSLTEDIERYRVHFNGQLLDLLTRQNWCESIITEKVKSYQIINDRMQCSSALSQTKLAVGSQYEQRIQVLSESTFVGAVNTSSSVKAVATSQAGSSFSPSTTTTLAPTSSTSLLATTSNSMAKSVNAPISNISLNPNGHQANQGGWFDHDRSSYC